MATIDINSGAISEHLANAAAALKDGYVIVAPLENSYALVADAFFHDAVRALHVLRGDELGVSAQVMIGSSAAVDGIAREISEPVRKLINNFWPGQLSINLKPQRGLNWDLGDGQQLDSFSVRVPSADFILQLAKAHGPLAVASAAPAGNSPITDPFDLTFTELEVAAIFSVGSITQGPATTVVAGDSDHSDRTRHFCAIRLRLARMSAETFYGPDFALLSKQDPDIAAVLLSELKRQQTNLQLIASENFTSRAVLAALGSTLSNKYAEGYPGKRYYGGCEEVDKAEVIAIDRAKSLFGAEHANVQPHSGASANVAVYQAFTKPGDTVLAMSLAHGGHLTHGSPVNFSGKWFNVESYGVRQDNELIDYDELRDIAIRTKPKMICSGATAYPSLVDFEKIRAICDEVGAIMWVDAAHFIGLVAGKAIPSPVPYADVVSFTTHKVLRGPRGGMILAKAEHAAAIDKAVFPGMQGGPIISAVAGKAIALAECATPAYQKYAKDVIVNAQALAAALEKEGMRAVSGGTQTHLALMDIRSTGVTGKVADERCGLAGIVMNKNSIPFDPEKPGVTSGIRVGTPATTTQGMGVAEMQQIAAFIARAIKTDDEKAHAAIKSEVHALTARFPIYTA